MMTVRRVLLLLVAGAALTAVLGGLARLGLGIGFGPAMADRHGPLFVLGVFGTVISLERAVALGRSWALAAPVVSVAAASSLLLRLPFAPALFVVAVALTLLVNAVIIRRQSAAFTWLMLLGSVTLLEGTFAWARGAAVFDVIPGWKAFFVLTIVAERLELSRLVPTPEWARGLVVLFATGLGLTTGAGLLDVDGAGPLAGMMMALLGLWAFRFDLARRTVRQRGLPRYTALGVLLGAGWLVVSGLGLVALEVPPAGPRYDAVLHALFVGYVLSMVFAHAPLILPAVARIALPMHAALYVPVVVLQLGLVLRLVGDLAEVGWLRQLGAALNVATLGLFLISVLISRRASVRRDAGR